MTDRRGADDQLRLGEDERPGMSGQYNPAVSSSSGYGPGSGGHSAQAGVPPDLVEQGSKDMDKHNRPPKMKPDLSLNSLDLLSRRKDLPEDLACFLLQQKQRQARLETTMRSFPSSLDMDQEKQDLKRKRGSHEDPLSHRVIEKRRRDRMNSCLADLSRLIPSSYTKKGRGRIEKTEIIEMAIKHMRHLQHHPCQANECDMVDAGENTVTKTSNVESFRVGYHECLTETMHFLVEKEGLYAGDPTCVRLINHLQKHYDQLNKNNAKLSREHPNSSHPHGKIWSYKPKEDRSEEGVKSEISEESGYHSVKTEEEGLNLSTHASSNNSLSGSAPSYHQLAHGEGSSSRDVDKDRPDSRQEFYSRERKSSYTEPNMKNCEMDQDGPSDLSLKGDSIHDSESNRYKFKSNIQKRFSQQDPSIGGSGNNNGDWLSSSRDGSSAKQSHGSSAGNSRGGIEQSPDLEIGGGGGSDRVRIASDGSAYGGSNSGAGVGERYPNLSLDCDMKSRMVEGMDSGECEHTRQKQSPENIAPLSSQQSPSVPIFALNSRGSYYVPMTVGLSVISPFMSLYKEESCPILHPVTISVNFQSVHVEPRPNNNTAMRSTHTSVIKHWKDRGSS